MTQTNALIVNSTSVQTDSSSVEDSQGELDDIVDKNLASSPSINIKTKALQQKVVVK